MAFLPLIVGPVASLLDTVLTRILPGVKMSEEDKTKLANEMQLAVMKQDWSGIEKEFQDRADARALATKDVERGNAFTNILAATVRPAYGFWGLAILTLLVIGKQIHVIEPDAATMALVQDVVKTVISFYFGGRVVEKVTSTITDALKRK